MKRIILPTFTHSEIGDIMHLDFSFMEHQRNKLMLTYYKNFIRKRKPTSYIRFKPQHIVSNRGLDYIVQIGYDAKSKSFDSITYAYHHKPNGIYVYSISDITQTIHGKKGQSIVVYTPHFFDRYRTRLIGDESINKMDVIKHFVENRTPGIIHKQENDKYADGVVAFRENGMELGVVIRGKNIIEIKTYVSTEMLRTTQITDYEECNDLIQTREIQQQILNILMNQ